MLDKQYFQTKDLILRVSKSVNPKVFDVSKYEAFLDALCGDREYQKDAIIENLRYLLGQQYKREDGWTWIMRGYHKSRLNLFKHRLC